MTYRLQHFEWVIAGVSRRLLAPSLGVAQQISPFHRRHYFTPRRRSIRLNARRVIETSGSPHLKLHQSICARPAALLGAL